MRASARPSAPIWFGSADDPLFGWFHAPRGNARATGIVVCNPIGDDYVRAHRALRHLAERLQQTGFPVLRFDFHGTGDSSGDERQPGRVRRWLDDVGRAVDELRARAGVQQVALVGLKLGATLAMVAAADRADVDAVVLWSPYLDGRAYVDETTRLHKMHKMLEPHGFAIEPPGWRAPGDEALGFLLTPETVADLGSIDLLHVGRPARHAFIVAAGNSTVEKRLYEQLRGLGVATAHAQLPGNNFLITIPHKSTLPDPMLDAIVAWCAATLPEPAATPTRAVTAVPSSPVAALPEEAIVFGDGDALFGILTRPPPSPAAGKRPAIVLLSAGTVHRIGPHRFYVVLARRWAQLGFHVFRVDLSGIGDSAAGPGADENLCYPPTGIADVQQAMSALTRAAGIDRFVLAGLCSGGDLTFQTAMRDNRVVGAVIINPRTFCVNDLELVETYKRARYYVDSLRDTHKLMRLLRGDVEIRRAVMMMLGNVRRVWRRRRAIAGATGTVNDVPACLRMMAEGGIDTLLVASENDPGVEYVDRHFARGMRSLARVRNFRRADFPGTDHTFTSLYAQEQVAATISSHLVGRYAS